MTQKILIIIIICSYLSFHGLREVYPFSPGFFNDSKIKNFEVSQVNRFAVRKDPFVASLLSSMMPGVGQIYAEDYTNGSLIILGDVLGKATIVTMIITYTNKYSTTNNDTVGWEDLNGGDKALLLGVSIIYLGFYIWNIIDAAKSARDYNLSNFKEPSLNLAIQANDDYFKIGITKQF